MYSVQYYNNSDHCSLSVQKQFRPVRAKEAQFLVALYTLLALHSQLGLSSFLKSNQHIDEIVYIAYCKIFKNSMKAFVYKKITVQFYLILCHDL